MAVTTEIIIIMTKIISTIMVTQMAIITIATNHYAGL